MSEPENFIARWSRRKRDAAQAHATEQDAETKPAAAPGAEVEGARAPEHYGARDAEPAHGGASEPAAFDLSKLPPIESITADSDIRAFLAPGVPPELTRAALRRAWSADPAIRDYVGLSENAWDFNAPDSVPGFGALEMTQELRRQIARMVGRSLAGEEIERPAPTAAEGTADRPPVETSRESAAVTAGVPARATQSNRGKPQNDPAATDNEQHNSTPAVQRSKADTAAQYDPGARDNHQVIAKRPHGSALPK